MKNLIRDWCTGFRNYCIEVPGRIWSSAALTFILVSAITIAIVFWYFLSFPIKAEFPIEVESRFKVFTYQTNNFHHRIIIIKDDSLDCEYLGVESYGLIKISNNLK